MLLLQMIQHWIVTICMHSYNGHPACTTLCLFHLQLDVSVTAVAPDAWLSCSDDCKLAWMHDWVIRASYTLTTLSTALLEHSSDL
jgi:hypothetical protein